MHSYEENYVWTQHINDGIRNAFVGDDVIYRFAYMDGKTQPSPTALLQATERIVNQYQAFAPDVVIAADDIAQAYFVVPYLLGKPGAQVVACGVNAPPERYGFPSANVACVRERWHYREGFALLHRLSPSIRRVAFVVDASETGRMLVDDLLQDMAERGPYDLELAGVATVGLLSEWKRTIAFYQQHADALALGLYHTVVDDATGRVVPADELMAWTNSVNTKPTVGFSDVAMDHGILCGVLESGSEQGYIAGGMARRVLVTGVQAGTLPLGVNRRGVVMLNLRTAERLDLRVPYELIEAASVVLH